MGISFVHILAHFLLLILAQNCLLTTMSQAATSLYAALSTIFGHFIEILAKKIANIFNCAPKISHFTQPNNFFFYLQRELYFTRQFKNIIYSIYIEIAISIANILIFECQKDDFGLYLFFSQFQRAGILTTLDILNLGFLHRTRQCINFPQELK